MAYEEKSKCRACGAEIEWALTEKGKRVPIDPARVDRTGDPLAQYALYEDPITQADTVHFITAADPLVENEERLVRVHFASCPKRNSAPRSIHGQEHRLETRLRRSA